MFNIGDEINIKTCEELLKEGIISELKDLDGAYFHKETKFILLPDFPYYGTKQTIIEIDKKDPEVSYFTDANIWIPKFLIKDENNKNDEKELGEKDDVIIVVDKKVLNKNDEKDEKVYINKFNNRKFGPLFVKLIKLDEKVSEFSNTVFRKLKKHELQYIATILMAHGAPVIDFNKVTVPELAGYCHSHTIEL